MTGITKFPVLCLKRYPAFVFHGGLKTLPTLLMKAGIWKIGNESKYNNRIHDFLPSFSFHIYGGLKLKSNLSISGVIGRSEKLPYRFLCSLQYLS